jgi:hypothetical protein
LKGPLEPFALVNLLRVDTQPEAASAENIDSKSTKMPLQEVDLLCNCKNQLSGLVNVLNQLENSSSGCLSRSQIDDALQQQLVELTVQAHSIMEQSLKGCAGTCRWRKQEASRHDKLGR